MHDDQFCGGTGRRTNATHKRQHEVRASVDLVVDLAEYRIEELKFRRHDQVVVDEYWRRLREIPPRELELFVGRLGDAPKASECELRRFFPTFADFEPFCKIKDVYDVIDWKIVVELFRTDLDQIVVEVDPGPKLGFSDAKSAVQFLQCAVGIAKVRSTHIAQRTRYTVKRTRYIVKRRGCIYNNRYFATTVSNTINTTNRGKKITKESYMINWNSLVS